MVSRFVIGSSQVVFIKRTPGVVSLVLEQFGELLLQVREGFPLMQRVPRTRYEQGSASPFTELVDVLVAVVHQQRVRMGTELFAGANEELAVQPLRRVRVNPLQLS